VSVLETVLPAGTWNVDPAHTTVEFAVKHMGLATVKGRAASVEGSLVDGRLAGEVDAAGITTHEADRDAHLASPDFFDVERYPRLRLATTEIAQDACSFIRALVGDRSKDAAGRVRVLYGGSMKPDNAADLLAQEDIDGGLIGGASLVAADFLAICAAVPK
jgi:triosephosphate isomerase